MKLALIDEKSVFTDALKTIFLSYSEIREVNSFANAEAFIEDSVQYECPDLIILDLSLPGQLTMVPLEKIRHSPSCGRAKILILSAAVDGRIIRQAIKKGATGYLSLANSIDELIEAVFTIYQGGQYISGKLKGKLISTMFEDKPGLLHLSPRERDVLQLVCAGSTLREAAFALNLSFYTVQAHHKKVMKKFNVNRIPDLIVSAINQGFYIPGC